jgi:hypothetical protein
VILSQLGLFGSCVKCVSIVTALYCLATIKNIVINSPVIGVYYTTDDILVGGAGNDTLTGAGGRDIFDYGFKNAGNDTITDLILSGSGIGVVCDIPSNIALDSALTSSSIELCPTTQGAIHII